MPINRRKLFRDAWAYAKAFAAFDRSSPRARLADALRKVWAEAKAIAARLAAALTAPQAVNVCNAVTRPGSNFRLRYTNGRSSFNPW